MCRIGGSSEINQKDPNVSLRQLKGLLAANRNLKSELAEKSHSLDESLEQLAECSEKLIEAETASRKYKEQLDVASKNELELVEAFESERVDFQNQITRLKDESAGVEDLFRELEMKSQENSKLMKQIQAYSQNQTENQQFDNHIEELQTKLDQVLTAKDQEIAELRDKLNNTISDADLTKIDKLQKLNNKFKTQITDLQNQVDQLNQDLWSKEEEIESLSTDSANQNELTTLRQSLRTQSDTIDDLRSQIELLKRGSDDEIPAFGDDDATNDSRATREAKKQEILVKKQGKTIEKLTVQLESVQNELESLRNLQKPPETPEEDDDDGWELDLDDMIADDQLAEPPCESQPNKLEQDLEAKDAKIKELESLIAEYQQKEVVQPENNQPVEKMTEEEDDDDGWAIDIPADFDVDTSEVDELRQAKEGLESQLSDLRKEHEVSMLDHARQIDSLQAKLATANQSLKDCQTNDLAQLQQKLTNAELEHAKQQQMIDDKDAELAKMNLQLSDSTAAHSKAVGDLKIQMSGFEAAHSKKVDELQKQISNSQVEHSKEIADLQKQLADSEAAHSKEVDELQKQLADSEAAHTKEIIDIRAHHAEELDELRKQIAAASEHEIGGLKQEKADLEEANRKTIADLQDTVTSLQRDIVELRTKNQSNLAKAQADFDSKLKLVEQSEAASAATLEDERQAHFKTKQALDELTQRNNDVEELQGQVNQVQQANKALSLQLEKQAQSHGDAMQALESGYKEQVAKVQQANTILSQHLTATKTELEKQTQNHQALESGYKEQIATHQHEQESLVEKNASEIASLNASHDEAIETLTARVRLQEATASSLSTEKEQLLRQISKLETAQTKEATESKAAAEDEIAKLQSRIDELQTQSLVDQNTIRELTAKLSQERKANSDLASDLKESEIARMTMETEIATAKLTAESMDRERDAAIESLKDQLLQAQNDLAELKSANHLSLQNDNSGFSEQIESLTAQNQSLTDDIDQLESALDEMRQQNSSILSQSASRDRQMEATKATLEEKLQRVTDELNRARQELRQRPQLSPPQESHKPDLDRVEYLKETLVAFFREDSSKTQAAMIPVLLGMAGASADDVRRAIVTWKKAHNQLFDQLVSCMPAAMLT